MTKEIKLVVSKQRNNSVDGDKSYASKTCFLSSFAAQLKHNGLLAKRKNADNDLLKFIVDNEELHKAWAKIKIGSWIDRFRIYQVFDFMVQLAKWYGLESERISKNLKYYAELIEKDIPVLTSTKLTKSGHVVNIVAVDIENNRVKIADPYGEFPYQTKEQKESTKPYWIDAKLLKSNGLIMYRLAEEKARLVSYKVQKMTKSWVKAKGKII